MYSRSHAVLNGRPATPCAAAGDGPSTEPSGSVAASSQRQMLWQNMGLWHDLDANDRAKLGLPPRTTVPATMDGQATTTQQTTTATTTQSPNEIEPEFIQANKRLFRTLCDAAHVGAGDAVLDAGCGCGEELLLLEREYAPRRIVGVTKSTVQWQACRELLEHSTAVDPPRAAQQKVVGERERDRTNRPVIVHDDAVSYVKRRANAIRSTMAQPIAAAGSSNVERDDEHGLSVVIACDCMYHFKYRPDFLAGAAALLRHGIRSRLLGPSIAGSAPGSLQPAGAAALPRGTTQRRGRFIAADLILKRAPSWSESLVLRAICAMSSTPFANMVTVEQYDAQLRVAGFDEVVIVPLKAEHTFLPLARHIDAVAAARTSAAGEGGVAAASGAKGRIEMLGFEGFARVARWWSRTGLVAMAIVSASIAPEQIEASTSTTAADSRS